ncbi:helix-turn-helix domain-containing protein [Carboxylicivirga sediminis]|uniref:Helix-turn-helix domain-containing protein n=1 Tax=Carboxylicivirga sediminis TaxID=2006564 RepID=A0A941F4Z8_9BACT|nr:AraC family transcriptional regulator [Carboxylicivirga sediminis]MBR8536059.1 helix-turn-helix domain-containing protein [Carboxylicivirga sediminis]
MPTNRFTLQSFLSDENEAFHIARTTINSLHTLQLHQHNYAEVFWVKEGQGIHLINGEEVPVKKGTLCLIRPDDKHTFRLDKQQEQLVVTNIAFLTDSLDGYKQRYFPNATSYFWATSKLPFSIQLSLEQLNEISALTDRLWTYERNHLHLDFIMIHIFKVLKTISVNSSHVPHWLAFALDNFNSPETLRGGVQAFVALTGRTVAHVNRVLQEHLEQTLTETVIKVRLQYVCQQLIMTNSSIKSICFDCGFESVSYFYRLFKKHYSITPLDYRKRNHKIF